MSSNRPTPCPKCGFLSGRYDVCEACGALIARIRDRNPDAQQHNSGPSEPHRTEADAAYLAQSAPSSTGYLTKTVLALLLLTAGAFGIYHFRHPAPPPEKASSYVHEFEDTLFEEQILNASADQTWVVDFFATWCGPCKRFAPEFDATAQKLGPKASFARVNVDIAEKVSARYGIRYIPTVMMFRGGRMIAQSGGLSRNDLDRWITSNL